MKLDTIQPQRRNANRHTERGMRELEASIQQDGMIGAITVAANGEIFDGSARREVIETAGLDDAIIVRSDGSKPIIHIREDIASADDPRAIRLGLAANKIAADNLSWDAALLAEIQAQDADLLAGLFSESELDALLAEVTPAIEPGAGGDEFDTTPAEGPTRTQRGDLWQLGEHRLLVDDCTVAANVARLMGGKQLRMVWTDPPYGVSYADKNEFLNKAGKGNSNQSAIANDHMSEKDTEALAFAAFKNAHTHGVTGASIYVACPAGTLLPLFIAAVGASGFTYKHSLAWVKNQFVLGRCDYHYRHEVILYGWIENGAHYFVNDHTKSSVIEVDKPRNSDDHPTMKPIELVLQMICNSSRKGEIVYDPFLGSGTTLIAAQRTGRIAYGCEIEPKYADVILRRWEAEAGQTAQKAES